MAEIRKDGIPEALFTPAETDKASQEHIAREHSSAMHDGWVRLRKNKAAVLCFVIIVLIALMAIFAPVFSHYAYYETNYKAKLQAPSWEHPFGTDLFGRDQWVRIWYGTRISLLIGFCSVLINCLIGVVYGSISGYYGGRVDMVMQRITEIIGGVPFLVMAILFVLFLGAGVSSFILVLVLTGWIGMSRMIRAQFYRYKDYEYVLASRTMGARDRVLIFRHILPNAIGPIITQATFAVPSAIFSESFLSYLGLGIQAPEPSIGVLLAEGQGYLTTDPHLTLFPALVISALMLAFNLFGNGLRDAFDPRMRGQ